MKNLKKRLQLRFVLLAMAALLVLQCAIVGVSLWGSHRELVQTSDVLLEQLRKGAGENTHSFSVSVHPGKGAVKLDTRQNITISQQQAGELTRQALHSGKEKGFAGTYRYHIYRSESGMKIYFLSRSASMEMLRSSATQLILVSLVGLALMAVLLTLVSGWVVRPLVENQQRQKEFITAAGHQLKTPLAVISADAQILQTEIGENQWVSGILEQVDHLTDMTNALVTLAKADETEAAAKWETVDLSRLTRQVLDSFKGLGREVDAQILPDMTCAGNSQELRQLLLVLLDNSFRYCPPKGSIRLRLEQTEQQLLLTVENTAPGLTGDANQYTRRFYRGENAAGTGGSGLGLAIAEAIVRHHKGKLTIRTEGEIFSVTVGLRK